MKNKIKKITVNSLFNSIQFNSIPKIISLIALLLILLFSISCKSNENPNTEKPQQNPEEIIDKNRLIPSEWCGIYDNITNSREAYTTATVYSNRITYYNTYYISNYSGKNTWDFGTQNGYQFYNKFFSNEKGQRMFDEILENGQYTNIYVHREDKDK